MCKSDRTVIQIDWLKIVERLQHKHYYVAFILGFGTIPIYLYYLTRRTLIQDQVSPCGNSFEWRYSSDHLIIPKVL